MKFLDIAGVQSLWDAIKAKAAQSKTTITQDPNPGTGQPYITVSGTEVTGTGQDGHTDYSLGLANVATSAQGTKADSALQSVSASGSGYVTASFASKDASNNQALSVSLTTQNVSTAAAASGNDPAVDGLATALDVKNYVASQIGNLGNAMEFVGTSSTNPSSAGATVSGHTSWSAGDVVLYGNKEYVFKGGENTSSNWIELGDEGSYALNTVTVTGTNGLTGGGALSQNQTISHAARLAVGTNEANVDTTFGTSTKRINGVKVDAYGHVLGVSEGDYTTYTFGTGSTNGTISVTPTTNGTAGSAQNVAVYGLGSAAYKTAGSASDNVPVNGGALSTTANVPVVTDTNGKLVSHASGALGSAAFTDSTAYATAAQGTAAENAVSDVKVKIGSGTASSIVASNVAELDVAEGTTNGTISINSTDVAVHGLGTAAYTASTAYATSSQGSKADSAVQSVSGDTAFTTGTGYSVDNGDYIRVTASTSSHAVTIDGQLKIVPLADANSSSNKGIAESSDVKAYVASEIGKLDSTVSAGTLGSAGNSVAGVQVITGITETDGKLISVTDAAADAYGSAAAVEAILRGDTTSESYSASETLTSLRADIDVLTGGTGTSIGSQINSAINALDSSVNGSETVNVASTNPNPANTGTTTTHVTSATVLTSVTIHDGKFYSAASQIIEAIDDTTLATIFAS